MTTTAILTGEDTRLVREILKGSPEYRVEVIATDEVIAKAWSVGVDNFTVTFNGRWVGVTSEAGAIGNLKRLVK